LEQVFRKKTQCFGNIEFGVDCNVSVQRLGVFLVILFIEDAIKCVTNSFKLDLRLK